MKLEILKDDKHHVNAQSYESENTGSLKMLTIYTMEMNAVVNHFQFGLPKFIAYQRCLIGSPHQPE